MAIPSPLYFVEYDYGRLGKAFCELDRDSNSRADVIREISGSDLPVLCVLEVIEDEGACRNITEDIMREVEMLDYEPPSKQDMIDWQRDHAHDLRKHEVA